MTTSLPVTLDSIIFGLQQFGGISNYWSKLVEYVIGDPDLAGSLVLPGHLVYRDFNTAWFGQIPVLRETINSRIGRYLPVPAANPCEIFHTSYYRLPNQPVGKYVVSVYDFTYERYRTGLARLVHTRQKLASIRRADAVLCISESTRRDVIEFFPEVDPKKLHVIHLGVDTSSFSQKFISATSAYEQTVLFVGQRSGYKRFDLAVEAVRELPQLSLGVVGQKLTDNERQFLKARLGSRWHEFGPVSNADLSKLYSSVYAFIFPSDYEGFGLPILEAMACGCPVVAADLSSLPEVGGNAARYASVQSGESYASVLGELDSATVREASVRAGIERAATFSWLKTFERTKAIYSKN